MQEVWTTCEGSEVMQRYIMLNGESNAVVRTKKMPSGFMWQYKKKYGFAATVEEAKAWVEGLAVHFSIPAKQRWMTL